MGVRTTYVKVYDNIDDHPGFMAVSTEGLGLWLKAITFCSRNRTDGHFPNRAVDRWHDSDTDAPAQLTEAGRWHLPGHTCEDCPQPAAGYLYLHGFLEENKSREAIEALSAVRAESGAKGGKSRAAKQLANQPAGRSEQTPSRSKPETETETDNKHAAPAGAESDPSEAFVEFWTAYPRKVGKDAAAKAYAKAVRKVDAAEILDGLRNALQGWAAARTETRFVPHPSTWLNEGRWADEVPLPDMPPPLARPTTTVAVCETDCPGVRHEWTRGRSTYTCLGA